MAAPSSNEWKQRATPISMAVQKVGRAGDVGGCWVAVVGGGLGRSAQAHADLWPQCQGQQRQQAEAGGIKREESTATDL